MSFRLVPQSVTLNGEMAPILRYFPNMVVSGTHCMKVVDKAITMDDLRLLRLVVNVCSGTARRPRYKYSITVRWKFCSRCINSRLNVQYLSSIVLNEVGSRFWYFEVCVQNRYKKVHVRYLIS